MFKKLKQKIEAGDEGGLERISLSPSKTPGSAVRSPPASDVSLTLTTPAHIQPVSPSHHIVSSPASHSEESRDHSPEKEEEEVTRVFSYTASVTCSITLHQVDRDFATSADTQSDSGSHMEEDVSVVYGVRLLLCVRFCIICMFGMFTCTQIFVILFYLLLTLILYTLGFKNVPFPCE